MDTKLVETLVKHISDIGLGGYVSVTVKGSESDIDFFSAITEAKHKKNRLPEADIYFHLKKHPKKTIDTLLSKAEMNNIEVLNIEYSMELDLQEDDVAHMFDGLRQGDIFSWKSEGVEYYGRYYGDDGEFGFLANFYRAPFVSSTVVDEGLIYKFPIPIFHSDRIMHSVENIPLTESEIDTRILFRMANGLDPNFDSLISDSSKSYLNNLREVVASKKHFIPKTYTVYEGVFKKDGTMSYNEFENVTDRKVLEKSYVFGVYGKLHDIEKYISDERLTDLVIVNDEYHSYPK